MADGLHSMSHHSSLTGVERTVSEDEIIVSKTDLRGHITYANDVFCRLAGFSEAELLGQPHNIVRHPGMPGCVFKLLWDTVRGGREIFAYVVNRSRNGDHYWVFAHVTPSRDHEGRIVGFHSNRRALYSDALPKVKALYGELLAEESRHAVRTAAVAASEALLRSRLEQRGQTYDEFIFSLSASTGFATTA